GSDAYGSHKGDCGGGDSFSVVDYFYEAITVNALALDRLVSNITLTPGAWIRSPDTTAILVMQTDGNLVIYDSGSPVWATSWLGVPLASGSYVVMQEDGNLVMY